MKFSWAIRLASDTLMGSAGKRPSQEARLVTEVRTTTIAMSSSISPGTAYSAASATAMTEPRAASRTACRSICCTSASL
jgi:hypothetical protein